MLFETWLKSYLETFKKIRVKDSTFEYYLKRFRSMGPLKKIDLQDLTLFDIQDFINSLEKKGLSYSTIKGTYLLIEQSLKKALAAGIIKTNPCAGVELPGKSSKSIDKLSEFEVRQLLSCSDRNYYYPVFLFLLFSGMRTGELIGLDWIDIDFVDRVIHVRNNYYRGKLSTPKTSDSIRDIPLTDNLFRLLPADRRRGSVFKNTLGSRIDYHVLLTSWHRQQSAARFKNIHGLHCLRHTFASNLLHNNADIKTVSLLLGHKDIQTTLNFYCHSDIEEKKQVISKLNYNSFWG